MTWFTRRPPTDRSEEIAQVAAEVSAERQQAEAHRARVRTQATRVARIHVDLMHEGVANHFTERWQRAYREAT